ncbi:MAG TPA: GNAT family N-acetyltransferase [Patescibacteria group bacterium]|nr:GNAT family N-acetyltransferase [Patescibacteria group bacterium]
MTESFKDNSAQHRFELHIDTSTAFADYRLEGNSLFIDYVEAPPQLRGTGAAGRLMQHIADTAQSKGLNIVPVCSYAAAWVSRNLK